MKLSLEVSSPGEEDPLTKNVRRQIMCAVRRHPKFIPHCGEGDTPGCGGGGCLYEVRWWRRISRDMEVHLARRDLRECGALIEPYR